MRAYTRRKYILNMGGFSSFAIGFINTFCLFLSMPFLLAGYIMKLAAFPCDPVIYKPLLVVGVFLFALSCFGILGSCCGCKLFLWIYISVIFVMIIAVLFTMLFGATVVRGSPGEEVPGTNYTEYQLSDFSSWLRNKLVNDDHWEDVRSCMIEHDACSKFHTFRSVVDIVTMDQTKLTPIEAGCCKPPTHCGFEYESATEWKVPEKGITSEDPDCKTWSNADGELCYNCGACKAGYLALFLKYWRRLAVFNTFLLIVLVFILVIGCCAL